DDRVGDLVLTARDDPDPRAAGPLDRREQDDVVDTDEVGPDLRERAPELLLDVDGAVDDRIPDRDDVGRELLDRREAEVRQVGGDEVLPELARLRRVHRLRHVDQALFEAITREDAAEGPVGGENTPGP